jgi:hypothetical protein
MFVAISNPMGGEWQLTLTDWSVSLACPRLLGAPAGGVGGVGGPAGVAPAFFGLMGLGTPGGVGG